MSLSVKANYHRVLPFLLPALLVLALINYFNLIPDWCLVFVVVPLLPLVFLYSQKRMQALRVFGFWLLMAGLLSGVRYFTKNVQFNSFSITDILLVLALAEAMTFGGITAALKRARGVGAFAYFLYIGAAVSFWASLLLVVGNYVISGTYISVESMLAILQTNFAEGCEYLSCHAGEGIVFLGFAGIIAGFLFSVWQSLRNKPADNIRRWQLSLCLVLSVLCVCCLHNKNFVYRTAVETQRYLAKFTSFKATAAERMSNLAQLPVTADDKPGVYVLVIGESETRDHMGAYGYHRNTTPWLSSMVKQHPEDALLFKNAFSCHTQTVQVLTYALTRKNQYNSVTPEENYSIIDIAKRAGFKTVWLSNQQKYGSFDTPLTMMASDADQELWLNGELMGYQFSGHHDTDLLPYFDEIKLSPKMLIVVHLIGSHESYDLRYPEDRQPFGTQEYVDVYDNTISFTDEVLKQLYTRVSSLPNFEAMIYISDHGEYPEERSGHNFSLYNSAMSRIPLVIFPSQNYRQRHSESYEGLRSATDSYFTNDLLYNLVFRVMGVSTKVDEPANILGTPAYNGEKEHFRVGYGRYPIEDAKDVHTKDVSAKDVNAKETI